MATPDRSAVDPNANRPQPQERGLDGAKPEDFAAITSPLGTPLDRSVVRLPGGGVVAGSRQAMEFFRRVERQSDDQ